MLVKTGKSGADHDSSREAVTRERIPVDRDELDRERALRGWSKQELAAQAGVSPPTISDVYTRGWTSPIVFRKITAALEAAPPSEVAARLLGDRVEGAA